MSDDLEFTDRYQALGMPYPDPATMCAGQCEGIGRYPVRKDDPDLTTYERTQWHEEEQLQHAEDGCHFILCGDCGGTGKAVVEEPGKPQ